MEERRNTDREIAFVSWVHYTRRSESVAHGLGARPLFVEHMKGCAGILLPVRYFLQMLTTWRFLRRQKPAIVAVMNPPILLPCTAWLYACLHRARVLIDSHTGAFLGRWGRFEFLHRFLARRALATIVTNAELAGKVKSWGARPFVLEIEIPDFPVLRLPATPGDHSVCVINSFSSDEPLDEILAAARLLPDCRFSITGNTRHAAPARLRDKPANVTFTGYIADDAYIRLLNASDLIMVLVTADNTLLQGAAEAVAVEKPLITSDWPVLRNYFGPGALYVDNTPAGIAAAVRHGLLRKAELADRMREHKAILVRQWNDRIRTLRTEIVAAAAQGRRN